MPFLFEHGDVKTIGQLGLKAGQAQADVAQKQKDFQREMQERQFQQQEEMLEIQRNADKQALQASQDWEIQKAAIYSQAQVEKQLAAEAAEFQYYLQRQLSKQQELDSKLDALDRLAEEGSVDPKLIAMKKADMITGMRSSMGGGGKQTMADILAGLSGNEMMPEVEAQVPGMQEPEMTVDGVGYYLDTEGQLIPTKPPKSNVPQDLQSLIGVPGTGREKKKGFLGRPVTKSNVPAMKRDLLIISQDPRLSPEERGAMWQFLRTAKNKDIEKEWNAVVGSK